jgi:competence protein ComEC
MRVPAAVAAVPLLTGASAGVLLFGSSPERLILAAAAAALLCLLAGAGFLADDLPPAVLLCAALGSGLAGYSAGASAARDLFRPSLLQWFEGRPVDLAEPVIVEGVLREDGALVAFGAVVSIDVISVTEPVAAAVPACGGLRLVVAGAPAVAAVSAWRAGRTIRVPALLRRPSFFGNPGVPDDRRALALRGIILTGSVKSAALVEVTRQGGWLAERAAAVRARARRTITRHVGRFDQRSAAVATAILIGDRTGLSNDDERRLQAAGTYHVIAISGGNIAILTAVLIVGARALQVPYRAGATLGILVLLFYGEVAGGAPSVGRATTAAVILLSAVILDHRGAPMNLVAVAAVTAVAVRPATMLDGGFLLSFGATAAIILGVPRLVRVRREPGASWRRAARAAATAASGIAAATVCAEIALAPVGAVLFSRITFAGLVLNFGAIPLMTAVQCGSMALLGAAEISTPAADALGAFVHHAAWGLVESSRFVELAPWLARDVAPPAAWFCAVYYAACAALFMGRLARRLALVVLVACGGALVAGVGPAGRGAVSAPRAGLLRVVVLDVGQGDATVAVLPDGRAILVDAGGLAGTAFDIGGRVVVPALTALGVRALHALVVTHADPDHIGGAEAVIRRFPTAAVWEGVPVPPHLALRRLSELADARRMVWRTVRPGDVERAGGAEIRVHHPPAPDWERQRVRNDDSVVLELRYGEVSILLPGDIGRDVERTLIATLDVAPVVILKAAHHGSATSSSEPFVEAARPGAVIFSAGRNNRYGHPAKVVVDRLARRGVEMFSTAEDGAVFVETDGRTVEVRGWLAGSRQPWSFTRPGSATTPRSPGPR